MDFPKLPNRTPKNKQHLWPLSHGGESDIYPEGRDDDLLVPETETRKEVGMGCYGSGWEASHWSKLLFLKRTLSWVLFCFFANCVFRAWHYQVTASPQWRNSSSHWDNSRVIVRVPAPTRSSQSGSYSTWVVPGWLFPAWPLPAIVLCHVLRGTTTEPYPFLSEAEGCIMALGQGILGSEIKASGRERRAWNENRGRQFLAQGTGAEITELKTPRNVSFSGLGREVWNVLGHSFMFIKHYQAGVALYAVTAAQSLLWEIHHLMGEEAIWTVTMQCTVELKLQDQNAAEFKEESLSNPACGEAGQDFRGLEHVSRILNDEKNDQGIEVFRQHFKLGW